MNEYEVDAFYERHVPQTRTTRIHAPSAEDALTMFRVSHARDGDYAPVVTNVRVARATENAPTQEPMTREQLDELATKLAAEQSAKPIEQRVVELEQAVLSLQMGLLATTRTLESLVKLLERR